MKRSWATYQCMQKTERLEPRLVPLHSDQPYLFLFPPFTSMCRSSCRGSDEHTLQFDSANGGSGRSPRRSAATRSEFHQELDDHYQDGAGRIIGGSRGVAGRE